MPVDSQALFLQGIRSTLRLKWRRCPPKAAHVPALLAEQLRAFRELPLSLPRDLPHYILWSSKSKLALALPWTSTEVPSRSGQGPSRHAALGGGGWDERCNLSAMWTWSSSMALLIAVLRSASPEVMFCLSMDSLCETPPTHAIVQHKQQRIKPENAIHQWWAVSSSESPYG